MSQRTHKCPAQGSQIQELNELVLQSSPKESKPSTSMNQPLAMGPKPSESASNTPNPTGRIDYFPNVSILPGQSNSHLHHADDPNLSAFASNQSLDDFVAESYNKMGLDDHIEKDFPLLFDEANAMFQNAASHQSPNQIPSPSEKFQNLCLYSDPTEIMDTANSSTTSHDTTAQSLPSNEPVSLSPAVTDLLNETLATINEDSLKRLLYGHGENDNNLV